MIADAAIERAIARRATRAAILKDSEAYQRLYGHLQTAMTNSWTDAMREGIAASLDRLRDLGPGAFTKSDGDQIMRVLEASVGEDAIRAAMRGPVINLSDALFRVGAQEVGEAAGVSIGFEPTDLDALDILKSGNLYWVGESWNTHTQDLLAKALEDYFQEGMTREGLTRRFAEDFAALTERGQRYWELLADHTATRTREMGRVTGYDRAGAELVQVRAQLDERTTAICRAMHGRIITVARMRRQRADYLDAMSRRDQAAAKAAWTMHGAKSDFRNTATSGLPDGTAGPPYHFRCRTITVIYFGTGDAEIDRWTRAAYDREELSRSEVGAIVRRARDATWPNARVARRHFGKHRASFDYDDQASYSEGAIDLIRRGNRDVFLSIRRGVLNATFVRRGSNADTGKAGFEVTAVDLAANRITTHHWREKLGVRRDEVPAQQQPGRGVIKWLFS